MKENQVNSEGSELRRDQLPREGTNLNFRRVCFVPVRSYRPVRPLKNRQMSIKVAQT